MGWKDDAKKYLNDFYTNFEGVVWHEFAPKTDRDLIRGKICYAIFGPPEKYLEDEDDLTSAYASKQVEFADKIYNHIRNKVSFGKIVLQFNQSEFSFQTKGVVGR